MSDGKNATERLRELLDERGEEWEGDEMPCAHPRTVWGEPNGFLHEAIEFGGLLNITSEALDQTPEQAIAATLDNSKSNNYKKIIESKSARIEELRRDRDSLRRACNIGNEIIESLQSMNDQKNKRILELEATLGNTTCVLEDTESYKSEGGWVHVLECSNCGQGCERVNGSYEYCPNCGAKAVKR